jgi:hypothetical protein
MPKPTKIKTRFHIRSVALRDGTDSEPKVLGRIGLGTRQRDSPPSLRFCLRPLLVPCGRGGRRGCAGSLDARCWGARAARRCPRAQAQAREEGWLPIFMRRSRPGRDDPRPCPRVAGVAGGQIRPAGAFRGRRRLKKAPPPADTLPVPVNTGSSINLPATVEIACGS